MTKREDELLEEIATLKEKLTHAQSWMKRQVDESMPEDSGFFSWFYSTPTLIDHVRGLVKKIRNIHIFRRRYTLIEIWEKRAEAFLVGAGIILFWRGIWNLADHFLFPGDDMKMLSAAASLLLGMWLMILTRTFVNQFLDDAVEQVDK